MNGKVKRTSETTYCGVNLRFAKWVVWCTQCGSSQRRQVLLVRLNKVGKFEENFLASEIIHATPVRTGRECRFGGCNGPIDVRFSRNRYLVAYKIPIGRVVNGDSVEN